MAWVGRFLGPSPVVPVRVIRTALPDCCGTLPRGVVLWGGVSGRLQTKGPAKIFGGIFDGILTIKNIETLYSCGFQ